MSYPAGHSVDIGLGRNVRRDKNVRHVLMSFRETKKKFSTPMIAYRTVNSRNSTYKRNECLKKK